MIKTGLLHPYPGSKANDLKYPVWDGEQYDCILEPFVGSGHATTRMLWQGAVKAAFVADIDHTVEAVWQCWKEQSLREEVAEWCDRWYWDVAINPATAFAGLKEIIEKRDERWLTSLAAASIVIRKLTFGGVLRNNAQGKLNVALSRDKLQAFEKWEFEWFPWCDVWDVSVSGNWQDCLKSFEQSAYQRAICFIDPPYWLPKKSRPGRRGTGAMTPAYMHHGDPSGDQLFQDCVHCFDQALSNPRIKRVVLTNYLSEPLVKEIEQIAAKHKRDISLTNLGSLQAINRGQSKRQDAPDEGAWEIGGQRQFKRLEQLELLAA